MSHGLGLTLNTASHPAASHGVRKSTSLAGKRRRILSIGKLWRPFSAKSLLGTKHTCCQRTYSWTCYDAGQVRLSGAPPPAQQQNEAGPGLFEHSAGIRNYMSISVRKLSSTCLQHQPLSLPLKRLPARPHGVTAHDAIPERAYFDHCRPLSRACLSHPDRLSGSPEGSYDDRRGAVSGPEDFRDR